MGLAKPSSLLRQIKASTAGSVLIETAFYLPLALTLLGGMVDFSLAVTQNLQAQQAVARTLELAGNVGLSGVNHDMLRSEAARAANIPQDRVQTRLWLECDGVEQPNLFGSCTTSDQMARYVSVTIEDQYRLKFFNALSGGGSELLRYRATGSLRLQ